MINPIAQIQNIVKIYPHPNADSLEIAQVIGWKAIVKKGEYKEGDIIAFIFPDSTLPDRPHFSFYNSKSNRVKTIKLRGFMSQGIIENLERIGYAGLVEIGKDIHEELGIIKWEAPQPNDNSARGLLPFGIPKTDESNYQNLRELPFGELVDVTHKIDGQSASYFVKVEDGELVDKGVMGRTLCFKSEVENNYTRQDKRYNILEKLEKFCLENNISICLRGESHGSNIQNFAHNPHAKLPLDIAFFSVYLIDSHEYAPKGHPLYFIDFCEKLNLPTVPILERNVILTQELISKYDSGITEINGKPFEGVVIQHEGGSFKVINKSFDSKK